MGVPDGGGDFLGNQSADDQGFLIGCNTFIVIHPPYSLSVLFSKTFLFFPLSAVVPNG